MRGRLRGETDEAQAERERVDVGAIRNRVLHAMRTIGAEGFIDLPRRISGYLAEDIARFSASTMTDLDRALAEFERWLELEEPSCC